MKAQQPSRARAPDLSGVTERDGVRIAYEVFGAGDTTVLLMPAWSIVHSRFWQAQVAYLARHYRVVTFDGRGNGQSGRPVGAAAYADAQYAADAIAVMDATDTDRAALVALSRGATWSVHVAATHPERVLGIFAMAPACKFAAPRVEPDPHPWDKRTQATEGWAKYNKHHWLEGGYDDFLAFFFHQMFTEPHSTKQIEDCVGWGQETEPGTLVDTTAGEMGIEGGESPPLEPLCARVQCQRCCHRGGGFRGIGLGEYRGYQPRRPRPRPTTASGANRTSWTIAGGRARISSSRYSRSRTAICNRFGRPLLLVFPSLARPKKVSKNISVRSAGEISIRTWAS